MQNNKKSDSSNITNRFGKDSIMYSVAVIIPALIGIISISLYTRIFSVEEYGEYNQVYNTTLLVTTLFSQWIQQSIQRYRPQYKANNNLLAFNTNLSILLLFSFLSIFLLGVIGSLFSSFLGKYQPYYWISIALILTQFMFLTLSAVLQSDFKARLFKNYSLLTSILKFLFAIILIYFVYNHPTSIIAGLVLGQFLLIYSMYKNAGLTIKRSSGEFNKKEFSEFVKIFALYGFPMIGWFIGNSIINISDRYMLEIFSSVRDVGIYSANFAIVSSSLGLLTTPLMSAAHPIIMSHAGKYSDLDIEKLITKFVKIYLLFTVPVFSYIFVYHKEITSIMLGKEFREGSIIIPILFLGVLFWNLGMYGHKGYEIKEKTKVMLLFVFVAAFINILFNYLLIPKYGYKGSAVATMLSMSVYPILIKIFSHKFIKWTINMKSLIKILFSAFLAALVGTIINQTLMMPTFLQLLVGGIAGLIVYLFSLCLTKEIPVSDIKRMKQKIIKK